MNNITTISSKLYKFKRINLSTNKSMSHFRKCSDPDDKDHTLYLKDAILLDLILFYH